MKNFRGSLRLVLILELLWLLGCAEMAGRRTENTVIPPISEDYAKPILEENLASKYSAEYKKAVVNYLVKAEKVISSPRLLVGTMASDAKGEFSKLDIDYPDQFRSAVNTALRKLNIQIGIISTMPPGLRNSEEEHQCVQNIRNLISQVRAGLAL